MLSIHLGGGGGGTDLQSSRLTVQRVLCVLYFSHGLNSTRLTALPTHTLQLRENVLTETASRSRISAPMYVGPLHINHHA